MKRATKDKGEIVKLLTLLCVSELKPQVNKYVVKLPVKPHSKEIVREIIRDSNLITSNTKKWNILELAYHFDWGFMLMFFFWILRLYRCSPCRLHRAQEPRDCRLTGWALLCWCKALTWALLRAELLCENLWEEQGLHCLSLRLFNGRLPQVPLL